MKPLKTKTCPDHPRYAGAVPPRDGCLECWSVWIREAKSEEDVVSRTETLLTYLADEASKGLGKRKDNE